VKKMAAEERDVIVIGAGPNGLTCGAYLARAGADVLILERNRETGGGLATEEHGGFRWNYHATYMMLAELMPPYWDLELEAKGVCFVRPEAQVAFLFEGGKSFTLYTDVDRSKRSIARLSEKDAETFGRMYHEFKEMSDQFIIPATYTPPVPPVDQIELLQKADALGKRIVEVSEMSPREVIAGYGFQDPRVEAAMLYLGIMWGIDPDERGLGFMVPLYVYRMCNAALVRGGSHTLSSGIQREFVRNGGDIEESAQIQEIIIEDGQAKGVRLADGQELRAKAVVSSLNPEQTFLQLCNPQRIPPDLTDAAKSWEWEGWSYFTSHMALKGEPPQYQGYDPEVNSALSVESPQDVLHHAEAVKAGRLPDKAAFHACCATLFDPLQAPSAPFGPYHTLRLETWAPYQVQGHDWDEIKAEQGKRYFEAWRKYAPNLSEDRIIERVNWSPLDVERRLPDMKKGSIKQGAYTQLQMGHLRPNTQCSNYETPVKGLFVCGSSVHPGGMVILGSGYNAARAVATSLGKSVWWGVPDSVKKAKEKGYLP
jgi:phytoene dehydrogenase-like protein